MNNRCKSDRLSILPEEGQWIWDQQEDTLIYKSINGTRVKNSSSSQIQLKMDFRTGSIRYRRQNRPFEPIFKTKTKNKIILSDVIESTLNVMSEMFYIPIEFEEYVRMAPVQEFLLYLINYFYCFLDMINNMASRKDHQIDRSKNEKNLIRLAYANVLAALDQLTSKYTTLLLGINLKNFHHMRNGELFYSCQHIDQTIFESLFVFTTYFVWITFYRQNFEQIRAELARLFRGNHDMELLKIPISESLEGRLKMNVTSNSTNRHRLINCSEFMSNVVDKEAITENTIDTDQHRKVTVVNSLFNHRKFPSNTLADDAFDRRSTSFLRQSRLKSLLDRDIVQRDDVDANDELYESELQGRSPFYRQKQQSNILQRQNRLRGLLTRQLRSRNQSLIDEKSARSKYERRSNSKNLTRQEIEEKIQQRRKLKEEKFSLPQLSKLSRMKNRSILPPLENPLDENQKNKEHRSRLPKVNFQLHEKIGIIGRSYDDFDLIRLKVKPRMDNHVTIPSQYLITLQSL